MRKRILTAIALLLIVCFSFTLFACKSNDTQNITSIKLNKASVELLVGESVDLTATTSPDKVSNGDLTWNTNDESVATVSSGKVTAKALGTTTVTVTAKGGVSATCEVKVVAQKIPVTMILFNTTEINMLVGKTYSLAVTVLPENATNKTLTWVSDDENIATVENGVVTSKNIGTTTVTAYASSGKLCACKVNVKRQEFAVAEIVLSDTSVELWENETHALTAEVFPEIATNKTLTWTSSDNAIATVEDGKITAVKEGKVTITATSHNKKTATCEVTVKKFVIPVTSVTLDETQIEMTEGEFYGIMATVLPDDATYTDLTWTSSDESKATVFDGFINALSPGTVTITATSHNGVSATCEVTINKRIYEVTSVTLNEEVVYLLEGDVFTLEATVLPENATYKQLSWVSSANDIVSVENGVVTAKAIGTVTITAVSNNGKVAVCTVNVEEKIVDVESVTFDVTSVELWEGESYSLTATILPADSTDASLVWESSDDTSVTVANGEIYAYSGGVAEITATAHNGMVAKCTVTVKADIEPYTFSRMDIKTQNSASITSKEEYVICGVTVSNAIRKFCFESAPARIKGRGNSTWGMPKKPYKLKFDKKTDLFGNGKAKEWTLIANYCDPSLVRNHLAYSLANQFDTLESTTKIHTVDLYLNGTYQGVYLVCEQNEAGETRVNIDEDVYKIDTGYLIELDSRAPSEGKEGVDYFVSKGNYAIKSPDVEDPAFSSEHVNFIKKYVDDAYAATKKDWATTCEYLDVQTFADAYIIHEMFSMVDVGFASFYMHKDAGGKLKAGPLWDLDVSSGNCDYHENAVRTDYMWAANNAWYGKLIAHKEFKELISQRLQTFDYQKFIDDAIAEILKYEKAYERNFEVWKTLGVYVWPNTPEMVNITTWRGHVEYLHNWLTEKLTYMISQYMEINGTELSTVTEVQVTDGVFTIDFSEVENPGEILSVRVGSAEFARKDINGKTITLDTISLGGKFGEQTVVIKTDTMYIMAPILVVTKVFNTADELADWWNIVGFKENDRTTYGAGYYVLGDDIVFNSVWSAKWHWINGATWNENGGFMGTLDGRGHYISGLTVSGPAGMFGCLNKSAVIKDIAFLHAKTSAKSGFFAQVGSGLFENVYLQLDEVHGGDSINGRGIFWADGGVNGTIRNCFVDASQVDDDIKTNGDGYRLLGRFGEGVKLDGVIVITQGGTSIPTGYTGSTEKVYEYDTRVDMISATDWWTEFNTWDVDFWTTDNDNLPIANCAYDKTVDSSEITTEKYFDVKSTANTQTLQLNKEIEGTVQSVNLMSRDVSSGVTIQGKSVTITKDIINEFGNGIYTVSVLTDEKKYTNVQLKFAIVITTAEELINHRNYASVETNSWDIWGTTTTAPTYGGLYVLGNNIDLGDSSIVSGCTSSGGKNGEYRAWDTSTSNYGFIGTFDGQGHVIYGGVYGQGGLFGHLGLDGVVKNVAFVGASVTGESQRSVIIGHTIWGTLENCLFDIADFTRYGSEMSPVAMAIGNKAKLSSVITYNNADITKDNCGSMAAFIDHAIGGSAIAVLENVFVFSNYNATKNGTRIPQIEAGSYALATKISETVMDATSFDSSIWDLSGDKAKFVKDTK
ncbi:MAG: Ig-like domain-containing protein [Clostridia bacterium]|nr:Ig-like domain-containing protein [Clostridia bacterium]